ncbi:MAG: glycine zipper 2TM domain-containing protein [Bdellovibrionales bacterium]
MRVRSFISCIIFAAVLCTAGFAHAGDGSFLGTTFGAITGGVLGSQIGQGSGQVLSTTLGVAIGGTIGNTIGREIDEENARSYYTDGNYPYASSGTYAPISYYSYTPNYVAPPAPPPTYIDQNAGTYCREFSQEIKIDGKLVESYGTACLQPDGSWRIVP